jgi:hypothetical protein
MLTSEVWSVNPVFDPTFEFGDTVNQAALDAAALAIANMTLPTTLLQILSPQVSYATARVEVRDDATDNLIGLSIQARTTPVFGIMTLAQAPQTAVVCSIRTDTPGGSGRGRIYWPALGATLATTGRLNTPTTAALAADFKSLFNNIEGHLATAFPTIGFDLAVRSVTTHTTPHATRIQVGNVLDTQRRRRDALPEAYTTLTM